MTARDRDRLAAGKPQLGRAAEQGAELDRPREVGDELAVHADEVERPPAALHVADRRPQHVAPVHRDDSNEIAVRLDVRVEPRSQGRAPGSTRLINRGSILYVQSHGDFVRIVTEDGRYLLRTTLNDVEHRWEPFDFVRVHRQFVANLARAVELRPLFGGTAELGFAGGQSIPVARRHVTDLSRRLGV